MSWDLSQAAVLKRWFAELLELGNLPPGVHLLLQSRQPPQVIAARVLEKLVPTPVYRPQGGAS